MAICVALIFIGIHIVFSSFFLCCLVFGRTNLGIGCCEYLMQSGNGFFVVYKLKFGNIWWPHIDLFVSFHFVLRWDLQPRGARWFKRKKRIHFIYVQLSYLRLIITNESPKYIFETTDTELLHCNIFNENHIWRLIQIL